MLMLAFGDKYSHQYARRSGGRIFDYRSRAADDAANQHAIAAENIVGKAFYLWKNYSSAAGTG